MTNKPVLHDYWRSGAAWRVRIALKLKGLNYSRADHDLRIGAQLDPSYLSIAPQGLVPALKVEAGVLTQSLATIEWLEDSIPEPALLPSAAFDRAIVRGMASLIACDIHPLNNLRVLSALRESFNATEAQVANWISRWINDGFSALEQLIKKHGEEFAFGHAPTMADCCLVPQVYSARRFGVNLDPYPRIRAVDAKCAQHPAFIAAEASNQPGADARL